MSFQLQHVGVSNRQKSKPKRWTDEELTRYRDSDEFEKNPWWEKRNDDGSLKKDTVDKDHKLLKMKLGKSGQQLEPAPVLWEILRRHPDLIEFRKKIRLYDMEYKEGNYVKDLIHWQDRSPIFLRQLLFKSHKPWPAINSRSREVIKLFLRQFLKSELNMPTGKKLHRPFVIDYPSLPAHLQNSGTMLPYFEAFGEKELEGLPLTKIREKVEKNGEKLVVMSVDPEMNRAEFRQMVIHEAERMVFGESSRDVAWEKDEERVNEMALKLAKNKRHEDRISEKDVEEAKLIIAEEIGAKEEKRLELKASKRNTLNITDSKLRHLAKLDRGVDFDPDFRKNVNNMFADFSLL